MPQRSRGGVVRQAHHFSRAKIEHDRGVEQLEARRAHNPKVAGSSPAPATLGAESEKIWPLFCFL